MRKLILGLLRRSLLPAFFFPVVGCGHACTPRRDAKRTTAKRTNRAGSSAGQLLVVNRALTTLPGLSDRPRTVQPAGNTS
jgi:hypothetical protein